MTIHRCEICHVSWYDGEPPKHVMDCPDRTFIPYPGPTVQGCEHKWDFLRDVCIKCGSTYQWVFDK